MGIAISTSSSCKPNWFDLRTDLAALMIRVLKLSGETLATVPIRESSETMTVKNLKDSLFVDYDLPVCMQQLVEVQGGNGLDDSAKLDAPNDVQLVLLQPVSSESRQEAEGAMLAASAKNNAEAVHMLLRAGADVGTKTNSSAALTAACRNGHVQIAHLLLQARAMDDGTALRDASINGHAETVHCLLQAGGADYIKFNRSSAALIHACANGHVEVVRMLLEGGANKNLITKSGNTALMCACAYGNVASAVVLVDAGADMDVRSKDGKTALICACAQGHI